jgi:endoglucanase Acf2
MTFMGQTAAGANIYKYSMTKVSEAPQHLIISKDNGNTKIYDGVDFVNHGYYVEGNAIPTQVITATGIESSLMSLQPTDNRIFTISGQLIETSSQFRPGIYIQNGRKFIIK